MTLGFAAEGDGGRGLYKEVSVPAPELQANKGYIHIAGDRWLKLVPDRGLNIEQFGGQADATSSGTGGTDNLQPLKDATTFDLWQTGTYDPKGHPIYFRPGNFRFSDTIELHTCCKILGAGSGFEGSGATHWHFPANKTFIIFGHTNTSGETSGFSGFGSSSGTIMDGINLHGSPGSTDHRRAGVHAMAQVHLQHIALYSVGGDGFRIIASPEFSTIADMCSLDHCYVHGASRNGLRISGGDANVCHVTNFSAHGPSWSEGQPISGGVGGCGILDTAWFGNKYDNIHIAGYGACGVFHLGHYYLLLALSGEESVPPGPGSGETTTPGTNDLIWYDMGTLAAATPQFPQWTPTPAVPYRPQLPVLTSGATHVIDNLYVEWYTPCHIPNTSISYSGTHLSTSHSNQVSGSTSGLNSKQGFIASRSFNTGTPEYSANGSSAFVAYGQKDETYGLGSGGGLQFITHRRAKDGDFSGEFGYFGNDIVYRYLNHPYFFKLTTPSTTEKMGGNAPAPFRFIANAIGIAANNDSTNVRLFQGSNGVPTLEGEYVKGHTYIDFNAGPGQYGFYRCTTGGVLHRSLWVTGTVYEGGETVKTPANKFYRKEVWGTSTVEPTHTSTSGPVTLADGAIWTYLGNTAPVFKGMGMIEA